MNYTYQYPRPAVTTDAILFCRENNQVSVLLIQRGIEPFKNSWALPGGFINMDEDLETACARELEEETGITDIKLIQFATYGAVSRDPRGRTISIVHYAEVPSQLKAAGSDDAQQAKWFTIDQLPQLAFDHEQIIKDFIRKFLSNN